MHQIRKTILADFTWGGEASTGFSFDHLYLRNHLTEIVAQLSRIFCLTELNLSLTYLTGF